ncbi:MAG: BrnT family toxin [Acetobacteraceae bacterium]
MEVAFDPAKDRANRQKHGASLAGAADMDFDAALVIPDQRQDYGEDRFQAVAPLQGRLHVLAFTMRGNRLRAISLRMANA